MKEDILHTSGSKYSRVVKKKLQKKKRRKCGCKPPLLGSTEGYNVLNRTSSTTFTLSSATGDLQSPPPAVGTTLTPGNRENFEVDFDEFQNNSASIAYTATAADGTPIQLSFKLNSGGGNSGIQNVKSTGPINVNVNQGSISSDPSLTITDK
ncbi:hypothetical protein M3223_09895 [Paenibacillus pasadenensis]|uniref:hypothetical protein n=1 Tax=Paenibacillus pasadenensis TaxID=217090 RepID=UPI00203CE09C|nr:hypothetical protein [Paenibacillus pasadenensis]MCM3747669.1 hypothetical protein [Paenibacillus pasadenensis]